MKVLIIEDEPHAAQRLTTLVTSLVPSATVVAVLDSVKKTVAWFNSNPAPDLALMDVQLADGLSFQIFEQSKVTCPVIFTTAYDQYAVKAFKVNGLDYLLKPVDTDELQRALSKLRTAPPEINEMLGHISHAVRSLTRKYKTRFVIKVGEHLKSIEVRTVRYFFSQDKATFCAADDNRNYIVDYSMEELEHILDPDEFFRISRKYIVRSSAIQDIISYTNSRLRLVLKGSDDKDVIVARERVQQFREWLDQ